MNKKQAKTIIDNYKPIKSFYDLSKRPETISDVVYAKLIETQKFLAKVEKEKDYYLKHNKNSWSIAKNISVIYQQEVYKYWGNEVFE